MYVCMYVCVCVCIYIYIYIFREAPKRRQASRTSAARLGRCNAVGLTAKPGLGTLFPKHLDARTQAMCSVSCSCCDIAQVQGFKRGSVGIVLHAGLC